MELPEFFRDYFLVSGTLLPGRCPAGWQLFLTRPLGSGQKSFIQGPDDVPLSPHRRLSRGGFCQGWLL